jgi:RecA/RadA recombinase
VALAALPRRDERSRELLDLAAGRAQPVVLAGERVLVVPGPLGGLLPGGAIQRGTVVAVDGDPGAGATTVAYQLAAAATATGEWAAAVELDASLGGLAAGEAGVALDRFAVIRRVPSARWAAVVAALLDGISVVLAEVPTFARVGDARRLQARARELGAVLVAMGPWPAEAALRLRAGGSVWRGLGHGAGAFTTRDQQVYVDGRGVAGREQVALVQAG